MSEETVGVFVVEDHEITRLGLKLTLEQVRDIKVIGESADAESALTRIEELNPQVVLMDIGLPGMDGIEAARRLKEQCPAVRIIMFTSHDTDDDVFAALAAGADGYALKNIPTHQLELAIKTTADGATWLDPGIASRVLKACSGSVDRSVRTMSPPKSDSRLGLTQREMEILELLVEGLTNQEMAEKLYLSIETIKTHMRHIMEKLSVSDRTQAAVKAMREGLV